MGLRIESEIVSMVGRVHRLAAGIGRRDPDLARQMRRSSSSVGLNAAEGLHARAGNRTVRLESAMCSGRETAMALRIAAAAGYASSAEIASEVDDIDRIVATLYKLAYRRGGTLWSASSTTTGQPGVGGADIRTFRRRVLA